MKHHDQHEKFEFLKNNLKLTKSKNKLFLTIMNGDDLSKEEVQNELDKERAQIEDERKRLELDKVRLERERIKREREQISNEMKKMASGKGKAYLDPEAERQKRRARHSRSYSTPQNPDPVDSESSSSRSSGGHHRTGGGSRHTRRAAEQRGKRREEVRKKRGVKRVDKGDVTIDIPGEETEEEEEEFRPSLRDSVQTLRKTIRRTLTTKYTDAELQTLKKKVVQPTGQVEIYEDDDKVFGLDGIEQDGIIIRKYYDYRPKEDDYFTRVDREEDEGIGSVIPFFNEPSHELQQTLNSLNLGYKYLQKMRPSWRKENLYICLIQDGWSKADESMRNYLKIMFPKKINGIWWWEYFEEFKKGFNDENSNITFVFERKDYGESIVNCQKIYKDNRNPMRITLVVKIGNRKKHNSHEWFLAGKGFGQAVKPRYLFLTDAFTLYSETCLYYLARELDDNQDLCAVTGRQRLMSKQQQGSSARMLSFATVLRMIQLYDFESSNVLYNGAFSLGGMLPVIPGPCGLYRAKHILVDRVRNAYFDLVNKEPSEKGLILGGLCIAEDRILTYYSVINTGKTMAFNPLAVFRFEAEEKLEMFLVQRRRWVVGSVDGYLYLLFKCSKDFRNWDTNPVRKGYMGMLLFFQTIIYGLVGISPGITIRLLCFGVLYIIQDYYGVEAEWPVTIAFIAVILLYTVHIAYHHKNRYSSLIMGILCILSPITTILSMFSLFHHTFVALELTLYDIFAGGTWYVTAIVCAALAVMIGPLFLSLFLGGRGHSIRYMLKSFIHYWLFVPLLVAWFGSYAYSRLWDLSWGNRPGSDLTDVTQEQRNIIVNKFKDKNIRIMVILWILNVGVFFTPLIGVIIIMALFFVIACIEMAFSFIFCLTKIPYKAMICREKFSNRE